MKKSLIERLQIGSNELREQVSEGHALTAIVINIATIFDECRDEIRDKDAIIAELRNQQVHRK